MNLAEDVLELVNKRDELVAQKHKRKKNLSKDPLEWLQNEFDNSHDAVEANPMDKSPDDIIIKEFQGFFQEEQHPKKNKKMNVIDRMALEDERHEELISGLKRKNNIEEMGLVQTKPTINRASKILGELKNKGVPLYKRYNKIIDNKQNWLKEKQIEKNLKKKEKEEQYNFVPNENCSTSITKKLMTRKNDKPTRDLSVMHAKEIELKKKLKDTYKEFDSNNEVYYRTKNRQEEQEKNLKQLKMDLMSDQVVDLTFQPKINERSRQINSRPSQNRNSNNVVGRLYADAIERKEHTRIVMNNPPDANCTFKPEISDYRSKSRIGRNNNKSHNISRSCSKSISNYNNDKHKRLCERDFDTKRNITNSRSPNGRSRSQKYMNTTQIASKSNRKRFDEQRTVRKLSRTSGIHYQRNGMHSTQNDHSYDMKIKKTTFNNDGCSSHDNRNLLNAEQLLDDIFFGDSKKNGKGKIPRVLETKNRVSPLFNVKFDKENYNSYNNEQGNSTDRSKFSFGHSQNKYDSKTTHNILEKMLELENEEPNNNHTRNKTPPGVRHIFDKLEPHASRNLPIEEDLRKMREFRNNGRDFNAERDRRKSPRDLNLEGRRNSVNQNSQIRDDLHRGPKKRSFVDKIGDYQMACKKYHDVMYEPSMDKIINTLSNI